MRSTYWTVSTTYVSKSSCWVFYHTAHDAKLTCEKPYAQLLTYNANHGYKYPAAFLETPHINDRGRYEWRSVSEIEFVDRR